MRWISVGAVWLPLALLAGCGGGPNLDPHPERTLLVAKIIRCEAGRWGGEDQFLVKTMQDEKLDVGVRLRAATAMGRIGPFSEFIEALVSKGLSHPDRRMRSAACFALGEMLDGEQLESYRMGPPRSAMVALRERLRDVSAEVRARAVEALAKVSAAEFLRDLPDLAPDAGALEGEDSLVLYATEWSKAAFRMDDSRCVKGLVSLLGGPARYTALRALDRLSGEGKRPVAAAREQVEKLLSDPQPDIRAAAVSLATKMGRPLDFSKVSDLLNDPEHEVRVAAIQALGGYPGELGSVALEACGDRVLQSGVAPSSPRKAHLFKELFSAAASLMKNPTDHNRRILLRWMKSGGWVASRCFELLAQAAPASTMPRVQEMAGLVDKDQVLHWILGLARFHQGVQNLRYLEEGDLLPGWNREWVSVARPVIVKALIKATAVEDPRKHPVNVYLMDPDPYVRTACMEWVASLQDPLPLLPSVLASVVKYGDQTASDPSIAAVPLLKKSPERGAALLEKMLKSRHYSVRLAAAGALFDLGAGLRGFSAIRPMPVRGLEYYKHVAMRAEIPQSVTLVTDKGEVSFRLFPNEAPVNCASFTELAGERFFKGLTFHRVVPNFVVQGGCPLGTGDGGPERTLPCEISAVHYQRGMVGMALSGKDTGGSQFFVTLMDSPHLDGGYTVFAQVVGGMDVVDNLLEGDVIRKAKISLWDQSEILQAN